MRLFNYWTPVMLSLRKRPGSRAIVVHRDKLRPMATVGQGEINLGAHDLLPTPPDPSGKGKSGRRSKKPIDRAVENVLHPAHPLLCYESDSVPVVENDVSKDDDVEGPVHTRPKRNVRRPRYLRNFIAHTCRCRRVCGCRMS